MNTQQHLQCVAHDHVCPYHDGFRKDVHGAFRRTCQTLTALSQSVDMHRIWRVFSLASGSPRTLSCRCAATPLPRASSRSVPVYTLLPRWNTLCPGCLCACAGEGWSSPHSAAPVCTSAAFMGALQAASGALSDVRVAGVCVASPPVASVSVAVAGSHVSSTVAAVASLLSSLLSFPSLQSLHLQVSTCIGVQHGCVVLIRREAPC